LKALKQDKTIDFHIRRTWHKIMRLYNYEASKQNATMSMGYALLNIDIEHGTPSTSLGPLMGMEPRSLTRTLKKMEQEGVIKRFPDKSDGRVIRIFLTPKGLQKREQAREAVLRLNHAMHERLTKSEQELFFKLMFKIDQVLEEETIFD
jgi:DNA-binding MarR family transcriptional regulator